MKNSLKILIFLALLPASRVVGAVGPSACGDQALSLVSEIVKGDQDGQSVYRVSLEGQPEMAVFSLTSFGNGSPQLPEAVRETFYAQEQELKVLMDAILLEALAKGHGILALEQLPFRNVTINRSGWFEFCKHAACNILARVPFSVYQPLDGKTLMIQFKGNSPISAAQMFQAIQSGNHRSRRDRLRGRAREDLQGVGELLAGISKSRMDGLKGLIDQYLPDIKNGAAKVHGLLSELIAKGGSVDVKLGVAGILDIEVGANTGARDALKTEVNRIKTPKQMQAFVERVMEKLSDPGFSQKVLSLASHQRESAKVQALADVTYKQTNIGGVLINVADLVNVGVVASEAKIDEFFTVDTKNTGTVQYRQTNVAGVLVNTFDNIQVNVAIRRGASLALAIREAMIELGLP